MSFFSHNQLTELPKNLPGMLTEIQLLHLQHNCLTSIPDDIGSIAKLDDLASHYFSINSDALVINFFLNEYSVYGKIYVCTISCVYACI